MHVIICLFWIEDLSVDIYDRLLNVTESGYEVLYSDSWLLTYQGWGIIRDYR